MRRRNTYTTRALDIILTVQKEAQEDSLTGVSVHIAIVRGGGKKLPCFCVGNTMNPASLYLHVTQTRWQWAESCCMRGQ